MNATESVIKDCATRSKSRVELWTHFIQATLVRSMAEVGVFRGQFASQILKQCPSLTRYYMIDPWKHLEDWNKPANKDDDVFEQYFSETKSRTEFAAAKRCILRGRTAEVIHEIPDGELDLAYVDGDHTLKGITIDLIRLYPKVRPGGFVGGDDFSPTVWQHGTRFEPTGVFPFAVYFAEAVGARIYGLPNSQYLIEKTDGRSFDFLDLTGRYGNVNLRDQFHPDQVLKLKLAEMFPRAVRLAGKAKKLIGK